jgi:predicted nicotinamide N-methyase
MATATRQQRGQPWTAVFLGEEEHERTLGTSFVSASSPVIVVGGLELRQDISAGMGGCVWDCGAVVSRMLQTNPRFNMSQKRVLDLGCGTGICGLTALGCGAESVILSDCSPQVLQLAKANALRQAEISRVEGGGVAVADNSPAKVLRLPWSLLGRRPGRWPRQLRGMRELSLVVICSDCFYDHKCFAALHTALTKLVANHERYAIIGYKKRDVARERMFFERLASTFSIELILSDRSIHIFTCSRLNFQ